MDHTICRADRCLKNEIITFEGLCERCPPGFLPNVWSKECVNDEEEETAEPTSLVAINSMNEPAMSEIKEFRRVENGSSTSLYLIIASGIGIIALIGVIGSIYMNRIYNQKGEPATTEMTNMQIAKEQSVSEEPMNKE